MKKLSKKFLLLSGVCAVLVVSCVIAYFSKSMVVTNPFRIGDANIYLNETFDVSDKWVPGEEKKKEVMFGNDGDVAVVIRARFTPELALNDGTCITDTEVLNGFQLNYSENFGSEWEKHDDGWYYYKRVLEPNKKTNLTLVSVTMNKNISNDIHGNRIDYSGASMDVNIECESIQATVSKDSTDLQNWDSYPVISETDVSWIPK